jgi:hypothetical protein
MGLSSFVLRCLLKFVLPLPNNRLKPKPHLLQLLPRFNETGYYILHKAIYLFSIYLIFGLNREM